MDDLFELLESKGLVNEGFAPRVETLTAKQISSLYEELFACILDDQTRRLPSLDEVGEVDPFTFFAGASVRGDSTCSEPLCRIHKIDFLARYAVLYATEVTVPLPLTNPDQLKDNDAAKRCLSRAAATLLRLRPLINAGIVKPVVPTTRHCKHTIKWVKQMCGFVHAIVQEACEELAGNFHVEYQVPAKSPTGLSTFYVRGPVDFLEHGNEVVIFDGEFWKGRWKRSGEGKTELLGAKRVAAIAHIFDHIASTTTLYLAYGRLHRARLLTDLPGEALVLNWLTEDTCVAATSVAMRYLMHAVPILGDLPVAALLRIRREERDAFESYRRAITRITSDVLERRRKLSKREAQQAFKDIIEPQLIRLKNEIRLERKRQSKRIAGGLATLAAGVAIGTFGLPGFIGGSLVGASALVGGQLLRKAAEASCEHGENLQQHNDLYFLVRVQQEAE